MDIEKLRLDLLANGYTPLPNYDKRNFFKGWSDVEVTPEEVHSWTRRQRRFTATGLRVENGLAVIDVDVNTQDTTLWDAIDRALAPALEAGALIRMGKGTKIALFARTDELFARIHSRRWLAPGATAEDDTHCVEIFGGASGRQFGAFGAHTMESDGTVRLEYEWDGASPLDVPLAALPSLGKKDYYAIADGIEDALKQAGYEPVANSTSGENDVHKVYDLTPAHEFDCSDGVRRSLEELRAACQALDDADSLRCSASWLEGPQAKRVDRCLVSVDRRGGVLVWESASGVTHGEASRAPQDYNIDIDRVAERLRALDAATRNRIVSKDDAVTAATKALNTWAFMPSSAQPVVPIWTTGLTEGHMTMGNFRTLMLPNADEDVGPRGGRQITNPADIWAGATKRKTVDGLQLRPDMPRPLFEENGKQFINIYEAPDHSAEGGSAALGVEFMTSLLPDATERDWFIQWLAHKVRFPHIPGPGVIMVARAFGTGRGTLGELCKLLLGERYVRSIEYKHFIGRTYQSQYNDWQASSLLTFVNESSDSDGGSVYRAKQDSYERLKEMVEPRPTRKLFVVKSGQAFEAPCFASVLIATNHVDALPLPATDRRFAVLTNGPPREPDFWRRFNTWMLDPANVAAFHRWLAAVDLEGYSPFEAPADTEAKRNMAALNRSDLDVAMDIVEANLSSGVFVPSQMVAGIREAARLHDLDLPDRWQGAARRAIQRRYYRVGEKDRAGWQLKFEGKKLPVYAVSRSEASAVRNYDRLREEVLKNGSASATGLPGNVLKGLFTGGE